MSLHLLERNPFSLRSRVCAHCDDVGTHHDQGIIWSNLYQVDRTKHVFAFHTHKPHLSLPQADKLIGDCYRVTGIASAPAHKNRGAEPGAFIILKPNDW